MAAMTVTDWAMRSLIHEHTSGSLGGGMGSAQPCSHLSASKQLKILAEIQRLRIRIRDAGDSAYQLACPSSPCNSGERVTMLSVSVDVLQRSWPRDRIVAGMLCCKLLRRVLSPCGGILQSRRRLPIPCKEGLNIPVNIARSLCRSAEPVKLVIAVDDSSQGAIAEAAQGLCAAAESGFRNLFLLELSVTRRCGSGHRKLVKGIGFDDWADEDMEEDSIAVSGNDDHRVASNAASALPAAGMMQLLTALESFASLTHANFGGLGLGHYGTCRLIAQLRVYCPKLAHLDLRSNNSVHGTALLDLVGHCTALHSLVLDDNALSHPAEIEHGGALVSLSARGCGEGVHVALTLAQRSRSTLQHLDLSGISGLLQSGIAAALHPLSSLSRLDLEDCALTGNDLRSILPGLVLRSVAELNLSRNQIDSMGLSRLLHHAASGGFPRLASLWLRDNRIADVTPTQVQQLAKLSALARLDLAGNEGEDGARGVTEFEMEHILAACGPGVQELRFGSPRALRSGEQPPGDAVAWEEATMLKGRLRMHRGLRGLAVPTMGFGRRSWGPVVEGLRCSRGLTALDASRNAIDAASAEAVGAALPAWPQLRHVVMERCGIASAAFSALAAGLAGCATLTRLSLSHNALASRDARALAAALPGAPELSALELGANRLGDAGAHSIARGVEELSALALLDLSANGIGDVGAELLARRLPRCPRLATLRLSVNCIGPEGGAMLGGALPGMRSLQALRVDANELRAEGAALLCVGVARSQRLARVDASFNLIGGDGPELLSRVLQGSWCGLRVLRVAEEGLRPDAWGCLQAALPTCRVLAAASGPRPRQPEAAAERSA